MTRRLTLLALAALTSFAQTYPRKAGPLTLATPNGPRTLAQYKGKLVLVAFIQTTCQHCIESTRVFNKLQNQYRARGVQFLEGAFNPEAATSLVQWITAYKPDFPVGFIAIDNVIEFAGIPRTDRPTSPVLVIVDRNGNIRARHYGADAIFQGDQAKNLSAEIEKYLK